MQTTTRKLVVMSRLLIVLSLTVLANPLAAEELLNREIDASPGEELRIKLVSGGDIVIEGWDQNSVSVEANGNAAKHRATLERRSGHIELASDNINRNENRSSGVDMKIRVPRTFDVSIDSNGGEISISDVDGTFGGKTLGGRITLRNLEGEARLETMGGDIVVTDSDLDGKVSTMGGRVTMRDLHGDLEGTSMGGNVILHRVTRRDVANTGDTVIISTMGGNIAVTEAPAGAKLHTMGGTITVESASDFVDAETMGGNVELRLVEGWVKASTMGGDVDVEVVGEGPNGGDITLTSLSGDIRLVVPRGFSMEIDVEIAYTKRHVGKHQIKSDVALDRTETSDWDTSHGSPRRYMYGKANVGGGQNRVTISTINGDVVIVEQ